MGNIFERTVLGRAGGDYRDYRVDYWSLTRAGMNRGGMEYYKLCGLQYIASADRPARGRGASQKRGTGINTPIGVRRPRLHGTRHDVGYTDGGGGPQGRERRRGWHRSDTRARAWARRLWAGVRARARERL